jgi:hypothetical protein
MNHPPASNPISPPEPARPPRRPWGTLIAAFIALAILGGLAYVAFQRSGRVRPSGWEAHSDIYVFRASSDSYGPLYDWLTRQPMTADVDIEWHKPGITVLYTRPAVNGALSPPWKALGYPPPLRETKSSHAASPPARPLQWTFAVLGIFLLVLVGSLGARFARTH